MLSLARAIPPNGPEPRWDEISLPSGTPLCIHYVETYRHSIHGSHKFAHAVERAQSKVLQRRIRRDPPGLSRSSNPTASCRSPSTMRAMPSSTSRVISQPPFMVPGLMTIRNLSHEKCIAWSKFRVGGRFCSSPVNACLTRPMN